MQKIPKAVLDSIRSQHWSEVELASMGVSISPALVNAALKSF